MRGNIFTVADGNGHTAKGFQGECGKLVTPHCGSSSNGNGPLTFEGKVASRACLNVGRVESIGYIDASYLDRCI